MQCLADGYFVLPATIGDYLSRHPQGEMSSADQRFKDVEQDVQGRLAKLMSVRGKRSASSLHRELGKLMMDQCGIFEKSRGAGRCDQEDPADERGILEESFGAWK